MTSFEQATLEQLVSFRARTPSEVTTLLACENLKQLAKSKVAQWDEQRILKGLRPWNAEKQ